MPPLWLLHHAPPAYELTALGLTRAPAEHGQELVDLGALFGLVAAANRAFDAMRHVILEDLVLDLLQRRPDRLNLGQDVDTVAFVFDHPGDAAGLSLDAAQAGETGSVRCVIHSCKIPQGVYVASVFWDRSPESANGTLPAPPHDASGHSWHHPDRYLFEVTWRGGQALAPAGFTSAMPSFGGTLSESENRAVLAYIN